jgi:hypothetical protein
VLLLPACDPLSGGGVPLRARAAALREASLSAALCHPHLLATLETTLQPLTVQTPASAAHEEAGSARDGVPCTTTVQCGAGSASGTVAAAAAGGVGAWRLCLVQELCNAGSLETALHAGLLTSRPMAVAASPIAAVAVAGCCSSLHVVLPPGLSAPQALPPPSPPSPPPPAAASHVSAAAGAAARLAAAGPAAPPPPPEKAAEIAPVQPQVPQVTIASPSPIITAPAVEEALEDLAALAETL